MVQGFQNKNYQIAVAVRDACDLLVILTVCRSPQGDVYVNFPRDYNPKWKPHSSYHASGQHHQKSYNHKALLRNRQRPDTNFRGTENVVTTRVNVDDGHALNITCAPNSFDDVFEIPVAALNAGASCVDLSVDIAEPGSPAIITPGAKILVQSAFKHFVPWILVTLFEYAVPA
ncbi:MAG TPA: hypothetical protein VI913_01435 [Candidatus Peribacteraceae bacterium]|nr:hypothetical protein [Candidatus Peribacteraceae bacterium]